MANNYIEIMKLVNAGNKMGLSNTITRDNGIPLDLSTVQESYEDAVIYAATKAIAYIGQPVSVGDKLYIISDTPAATKYKAADETEYDNYLKEVGKVPTGDNASITVSGEGLVSIFGFSGAQDGMLPIREEGKLTWKTLEAIGAGDGNDNTTYEFALNTSKNGIIVTPLFNGQPIMEGEEGAQTQKKFELVLDVYTKTEADEKFLAKSDYTPYDDTSITARVKTIEDDYLKTADKYDDTDVKNRLKTIEDDYLKQADKYDDTELKNKVTSLEETVGNSEGGLVKDVADNKQAITQTLTDAKAYTDEEISGLTVAIEQKEGTEFIVVKNKAGTEIASADASRFVQDSFLNDVSYDSTTGKITFTWVMGDGSTKTDEVNVSDFVQTYTAGEGLSLEGNQFKVDTTVIATVSALNGVNTTAQQGVTDAAAAQKTIDDYVAAHASDYDNDTIDSTISTAVSNLGIEDYAKSADVVSNETFNQFKTDNTSAISTAKSEAISEAVSTVEGKGYAVSSEVEADLAEKVDAGTIAHTSDDVTEGVTRDGTTLNIVVDTYKKSEVYTKGEVDTAITNKINDITGGESAKDVLLELRDYKKANDTEIYGSDKVTSWTAEDGTYTPIYTQDSRLDLLNTTVAAAQAQADKGVADAKIANDAITALTTGDVATNKTDITAIKGRLETLETAKGDHETRISTAEGKITSLESADATINTTLGTIAGQIEALQNKDSSIEGTLANKANKDDVYTKSEVDEAIQGAIDAIPEVDLEPYAKTDYVNTELNKKANSADVYTASQADAKFLTETQVDARIDALISASDPDADGNVITNIQNLVEYVENNAEDIVALVTATDANTAKLSTLPADKTVKDYVDESISAIVMPKGSEEITLADDGTLSLGKVSTDKLIMGSDTLVIDGGTASNS